MGKKHIGVIMGGTSTEHTISLETGTTIMHGLDESKYKVTPVIIDQSGNWLLCKDPEKGLPKTIDSDYLNSPDNDLEEMDMTSALSKLKNVSIDVMFIALHGKFGEDGTIQGLFEFSDIKYTGSGVMASAIGMNKVKSMELYLHHHLLVPEYFAFTPFEYQSDPSAIAKKVESTFGYPCVLKPVDGGSSAATFLLKSEEGLDEGIRSGFDISGELIIQRYIAGDEVTCAILDSDEKPIALPPTQIIPITGEFFDYQAKYEKGASEEVTPPNLDEKIIEKIQEISLIAHKILGCSGLSRTDMIVNGTDIFVLETNTVPGMTGTSLYPQAAEKIGLSFSQLLDKIIINAIRNER